MFSKAVAPTWLICCLAAIILALLNFHLHLLGKYLPSVCVIVGGMLLTDAIEIQRSGICPMRYRPDILREEDAATFRAQVRTQFGAAIGAVVIGTAIQIAILVVTCSSGMPGHGVLPPSAVL